jgi:hypothetical protein
MFAGVTHPRVCVCVLSWSVLLLIIAALSYHIVWGVLWLIIALIFFAAGLIVGLVAFKQSAEQQKEDAKHFLPVPGSNSGAASTASIPSALIMMGLVVGSILLGF